jgi:hypothetical protein
MVSDDEGSNNNNESLDSSESNKRKRLLKQKQITLIKGAIEETKIEFDRMPGYTIGDKKNQHVKILDNVKIHNYRSIIFRRKADMHLYFSVAAFGSESDTKIEYRDLWKNLKYRKKYLKISELDQDINNELK